MDVPGALRDAAAAWEQAGRPQQGATEYLRGRWLDALPEHADLIRALPERLNRSDSRELVAGLLERGDVVGAFVVSQIWGYGRRGYGPYRVRRVLDQDGAARRLEAAYDVLRSRGPVAAFAAFADEHRLTGLGPAFFTKFMFLADPSACALILDEYVAAWLQKHAGLKLSLNPPRSSAYRLYLDAVERWAAALRLNTGDVEQLIFAAEEEDRTARRR